MDRDRLKADLIRDEDRRLVAYRDSLGNFTIGIGHYLGASPRMTRITDAECDALYAMDAHDAEQLANRLVGLAAMTDARQRAVTNMTFNLGNRFAEFKHTLEAIKDEDWHRASQELLSSRWAAQVGARAQRIAAMIETGIDA